MDRADRDDRLHFIAIGESKVREDHRRSAYEVLNDKVAHIDRHGAGTAEVDDLRSSFDAFLRAEIIHQYEAVVWNCLIQKIEFDVLGCGDSDSAVKPEPSKAEPVKVRDCKDNKRAV